MPKRRNRSGTGLSRRRCNKYGLQMAENSGASDEHATWHTGHDVDIRDSDSPESRLAHFIISTVTTLFKLHVNKSPQNHFGSRSLHGLNCAVRREKADSRSRERCAMSRCHRGAKTCVVDEIGVAVALIESFLGSHLVNWVDEGNREGSPSPRFPGLRYTPSSFPVLSSTFNACL